MFNPFKVVLISILTLICKEFLSLYINKFCLYIHNLITKYSEKINLNNLKFKRLGKLAIKEMRLLYSECKDYLIKKYGNCNNDLFIFELLNLKNMKDISNPAIAFRTLKDCFLFLENDNSDETKTFLKKYAILNEEGKIKEFAFAPSFYLWNNEKNQREGIKPTDFWSI